MKRRPVLGAALVLAACLVPRPAAALGGGTPGGNLTCVAGSPQVIAQFQDPKQITGLGNLTCPPPGARTPGSYGPGNPPAQQQPPVPGQKCAFAYEVPFQFRLNGSTPQYQETEPAGLPLPNTDPMNPTWTRLGWQDLQKFVGGGTAADADAFYAQTGTNDVFWPWAFYGVWDNNLRCVAQPNRMDEGWHPTVGCTTTIYINACADIFPHAVNAPAGGAPVGLLGIDLNNFLKGQFDGGQVTSLPAQPHPGLTNLPTCFYVSNMTVNRQPANPQQDVYWERIVESPNAVDDEGRHVYFVFVIHVSYQASVWDFGDGTPPVEIPRAGSSAGPRPTECADVPNQQFLVWHTYQRYSRGDGFHVTVNHRFGVDVTEMWRDSDPNPHVLNFPNVIPPVTVPGQPQPYVMPVIQEEGVPIGA